MTYPLTVGEHTTVQAGLITFPQEILPFLEEGHTFTIEGSFDRKEKGHRRVISINLSIDVFNEEDEDPPNPDTKE